MEVSIIQEAMQSFSSLNTDRNLSFYDLELMLNYFRQQRKAINPAFHFDTIKEFVPSFYNKTEQLMQIWKNLPNKDVAITDWMHKFTLDVLGKHNFTNHHISATILAYFQNTFVARDPV